MRKTLVVLLALLFLSAAPSALALAPDENPTNPTVLTKVEGVLETLASWLGFSVIDEPEDGDEVPPVVAPDGDGQASSEPGSGGEAGPGWDPQG